MAFKDDDFFSKENVSLVSFSFSPRTIAMRSEWFKSLLGELGLRTCDSRSKTFDEREKDEAEIFFIFFFDDLFFLAVIFEEEEEYNGVRKSVNVCVCVCVCACVWVNQKIDMCVR